MGEDTMVPYFQAKHGFGRHEALSAILRLFAPDRPRIASLVVLGSVLSVLLMGSVTAQAGWRTLWLIGEDADPLREGVSQAAEFAAEDGRVNPPPGTVYDPATNRFADDDFYVAGRYPIGFNALAAPLDVATAEPPTAWERALTDSDPSNRVHFMLSESHVAGLSMLRLSLDLVEGTGWSGTPAQLAEGFGRHDIQIWFRGRGPAVLIWSNRVDRAMRVTVEVPATSVLANAGANTIEFVRSGPVVRGVSSSVRFDFLQLEVFSDGLADSDADGLPRWWEEQHAMSDADAADARIDHDLDGLSALSEYRGRDRSTDPYLADSDGDGLNDSEEVSLGTDPLLADTDADRVPDFEEVRGAIYSDPRRADSDSDGAPDEWERRVGTNPMDGSSKPTAFRGAIGLRFVSDFDPDNRLGASGVAGIVPQMFWNETAALPLGRPPAGSNRDILTPNAGVMVRSDGMALPSFDVSWTGGGGVVCVAAGLKGSGLLGSHFLVGSQGNPLRVTLRNIPFARYDIYVFVNHPDPLGSGEIRLNGLAESRRLFLLNGLDPSARYVEAHSGFGLANMVRYRNQTGSTAELSVLNSWQAGIGAIQIVDLDADADSSGIPDWYEMKHGLQPGSRQLSAEDTDGDGLTNQEEFAFGSDPRSSDGDGDGLNDVDERIAGSDPTRADTDGDRLSDGAEVHAALPSDPTQTDTDNDGVSDRVETSAGFDPASAEAHFGNTEPKFDRQTGRWVWSIRNVQLVWDHGVLASGASLWSDDIMARFSVRNIRAPFDWQSLRMGVRWSGGKVVPEVFAIPRSTFAPPVGDGWGIFDVGVADLARPLGFSGVGDADVSARLHFQLVMEPAGVGRSWNARFAITNQTRGILVYSRAFSNLVAHPTMVDGSATWSDVAGTPRRASFETIRGVQCFVGPRDLEALAQYSGIRDTDDDGMADFWEIANGFDPAQSMAGLGDEDLDGLRNVDEYLAGTNPRMSDTDEDGIPDGVERSELSDPRTFGSRPEYAGVSPRRTADLNGDGLPDAWQVRYGAFLLSLAGDDDGDGVSNLQESLWGTDPFDVTSRPHLTIAVSTNDVRVMWRLVPGKRMDLLGGSSLTNWIPAPEPEVGTGGMAVVSMPDRLSLTNREFYQIRVSERDSDLDGVSDWDELAVGMDPGRPDSARGPARQLDRGGGVVRTIPGDLAAFDARFAPNGASVSQPEAARFLQQASFGPTLRQIDRVRELGIEGWLEDQMMRQPATHHRDYIEHIYADYTGPKVDSSYMGLQGLLNGNNALSAFGRACVAGPDQLRQRVAFALSQILVTSRRDSVFEYKPRAMADYYDVFVRHAFGSYLDILREVTLHPVMGRYLSHVGNQKARPDVNQFPDENYAREIMQLFSIGLWELNPDGTQRLDAAGRSIPTYGNAQITELARVFTGFWFGTRPWGLGGVDEQEYLVPMKVWAEKHDFGSKALLRGVVIPARAATAANALLDVDDAVRNLFEHPNTGPFVCHQLIQFLVTSNPTTNYVRRVTAVFDRDGQGRRGNLGSVVRAILLDPEARDPRWAASFPGFGRLKEPVHRAVALARVSRLDRFPGLVWWDYGDFYDAGAQEPARAPTVFNFFRPDYRPPGLAARHGLVAPAFQIVDSSTSLKFPNLLWQMTVEGFLQRTAYQFPPDYSELQQIADQPERLVDVVNLLFCGGSMTVPTRDAILARLGRVPIQERQTRVFIAVYLGAACPDGAIQR
jgi:uncharacterized protein (DUF1800 family)